MSRGLRLELAHFPVESLLLGGRTAYHAGVLELDAAELARIACEDPRLAAATFELARPGERTRIIHVLDALAPSLRFPGVLEPPRPCGHGRNVRLDGLALTTACLIPGEQGGLSVKEAVLDLSGEGARYSPLSALRHLVFLPQPRPGLGVVETCAAVRQAALRLAVRLAQAVAEAEPAHLEVCELGPAPDGLPRVLYLALLSREGDVHATYVYGENITTTPIPLHPNEWLDGAVVSGAYHMGATRSCSYWNQENPGVRALYRRHGSEVNFLGTAVVQCLVVGESNKERTAWAMARLARLARADGVLISPGSGGHGYADLHLVCQKCEQLGIRSVITTAEQGDDEGLDDPLVTFVPEADAIVSTGNKDEVVALPAMERVLGGSEWNDMNNYEGEVGAAPHEAFHTALRRLFTAAEQYGAGRSTARRQ